MLKLTHQRNVIKRKEKMDMQQMMEFVQRFKNMDMSSVSEKVAKDMVMQSAGRMGATYIQSTVLVQNIFG